MILGGPVPKQKSKNKERQLFDHHFFRKMYLPALMKHSVKKQKIERKDNRLLFRHHPCYIAQYDKNQKTKAILLLIIQIKEQAQQCKQGIQEHQIGRASCRERA